MAVQRAGVVRISGALCVQRGTPMLQGFAEAATLSDHQAVDIFVADTGDGYQRAPITARVRKAAQYYSDKGVGCRTHC